MGRVKISGGEHIWIFLSTISLNCATRIKIEIKVIAKHMPGFVFVLLMMKYICQKCAVGTKLHISDNKDPLNNEIAQNPSEFQFCFCLLCHQSLGIEWKHRD